MSLDIILIGVLALAIFAILAFSAARARRSGDGRANAASAMYRGQLEEIENDVANGRLAADEAEGAKREVARRLLRATASDGDGLDPKTPPALVFALCLGLLTIGLGFYWVNGAPGLPAQSAVTAPSVPKGNEQLAAMLPKLEEKLKTRANDQGGWEIYARALMTLERPRDAITAFKHLQGLDHKNANYVIGEAQALLMLSEGRYSPAVMFLIERAAVLDPQHPAPPFLMGLAAAESGDKDRARAIFSDLLAKSPADAPWVPDVRAALRELDPQAAAPTDQMAMIKAMVARLEAKLAANPEDFDGWLRLARAWQVLGDSQKLLRALEGAQKAAPDAETAKRIELEINRLRGA